MSSSDTSIVLYNLLVYRDRMTCADPNTEAIPPEQGVSA